MSFLNTLKGYWAICRLSFTVINWVEVLRAYENSNDNNLEPINVNFKNGFQFTLSSKKDDIGDFLDVFSNRYLSHNTLILSTDYIFIDLDPYSGSFVSSYAFQFPNADFITVGGTKELKANLLNLSDFNKCSKIKRLSTNITVDDIDFKKKLCIKSYLWMFPDEIEEKIAPGSYFITEKCAADEKFWNYLGSNGEFKFFVRK